MCGNKNPGPLGESFAAGPGCEVRSDGIAKRVFNCACAQPSRRTGALRLSVWIRVLEPVWVRSWRLVWTRAWVPAWTRGVELVWAQSWRLAWTRVLEPAWTQGAERVLTQSLWAAWVRSVRVAGIRTWLAMAFRF